MKIPHRVFIRATYVTTGSPWVTTAELERPLGVKVRAMIGEGLRPGWLGRARELGPRYFFTGRGRG